MKRDTGYVHGFSGEEQARLAEQARFLAPVVFEGVDFSGCRRLLELGCGVGAQTRLLLERWPELLITAVDASAAQLEAARRSLAGERRVRLVRADAERLPFREAAFDGVFVVWLLEHVRRPLPILAEARRILRPGGLLHAIEVANATLRLEPAMPVTWRWWEAMNRLQKDLGGDPDVGARLERLLADAGFRRIEVRAGRFGADGREPERRSGIARYWRDLMLSCAAQLEARGWVEPGDAGRMRAEWDAFERDPGASFSYSPVRACAEA